MSSQFAGVIGLVLLVAFHATLLGVPPKPFWEKPHEAAIAAFAAPALYGIGVLIQLTVDALTAVGVITLHGSQIPVPGFAAVACGVVAVCCGLVVWARSRIDRARPAAGAPDAHPELVTDGPFTLSRAPGGLAALTAELCQVALVGSLQALVAFVLCWLGVEIAVRRVTERELRSRWGAAWVEWARDTGRFVPIVGTRRIKAAEEAAVEEYEAGLAEAEAARQWDEAPVIAPAATLDALIQPSEPPPDV